MSRIETIGNATLYLGDCRDILPTLPRVDAVITDPPYRLNDTTGSRTSSAKQESWRGFIAAGDADAGIAQIDFADWVPLLPSALREQAHVFAFANDKQIFALHQAMLSAGLRLHNVLSWVKPNATPNRWFMKNMELVWFGRAGRSVPIRTLGAKTAETFHHDGHKEHPTQKPVALLAKLVAASQGEAVLDPFMGSGTTGVACMKLQRQFIGIEREPKYFDIACRRIDDAQRQGRLIA